MIGGGEGGIKYFVKIRFVMKKQKNKGAWQS